MSDNYLTVIPTDPYWQLGREAADRAAAVPAGMLPDDDARRGLLDDHTIDALLHPARLAHGALP
ncbi:hypothetical protein [Streptomyces sp. SAS_270]|uniref:hypothetical protein n=1 Tax=Streptomyces sp. SAS_270 TaxID=3412748 RepID=UPI00403C1C72